MDAAFRAFLDAVRTDRLFADFTSRGTPGADGFITASTTGGAFFAETVVTEVAVIAVFPVHYVSAFVAGLAIPLIQRHVRTIRAVGVEDAFHKHEEIAQSVLFQGSLYDSRPLAFAKYVVAYVRMGYLFIRRSRMRVKGYAVVRIAFVKLSQLLQLQLNPEGAKVNIVQRNRPCYDRDCSLRLVELHLVELPPQLLQLFNDD